ncbi:S46 family peptidase [Roseiterribacter gracilis]|uniref:Dipeptidyl-peptidase n=1 Tax=Roseiterribacter gracilis TaxID=2812848 RepID=A0A8S8XJ53_9PROT|nr:dipeptidyl-peptidase [Rhodospirillales bacterium TMPK1]
MKYLSLVAAAALLFGAATTAHADEGMFTFNNPPVKQLSEKYGFSPDKAWLDRVQLASVRLARGCSGSFVSKDGLVLTNQHCVRGCVEQLSSAKEDLSSKGFTAKDQASERKCPDVEINQLVEITEVTDRITKATEGKTGKEFADALKSTQATIQKECATGADIRCDVVSLYQGGRYDLYKYRRYQDARLVFTPEVDIGMFGGDPDNFNFPRYDLDMSLLRVYGADGKPLKVDNYLPWAKASAAENDLVFTSGNPGGTDRQLTMAQLYIQRDYVLPRVIARYSERRGILVEFGRRGAEQKRVAEEKLLGIENSLKVYKGRYDALAGSLGVLKAKAEADFRAKVDADPNLKQMAGDAWDGIAKAVQIDRALFDRRYMLETAAAFDSQLFTLARQLVRAADERAKPNEQRLREYTDAAFPAIQQRLVSAFPISNELEIEMLGWSLASMRAWLSPDDATVKAVLGKDDTFDLAKKLVTGTKLGDAKVRKALLDGGKAAIDASKDPMILLAKQVDADARAVRAKVEEEVDAPEKKFGGAIAKARFALEGTSTPPDATFSPRLSYGKVTGWTEPTGKQVPYFTVTSGLYERATGNDPFRLPKSWLDAKASLDGNVHMNFVTTNDIVGGNSGSPMINQKGEVVGLAFDGNIHSIGGDYGYDAALNRCVGVDVMAMKQALAKVYKAEWLVRELTGAETRAEAR